MESNNVCAKANGRSHTDPFAFCNLSARDSSASFPRVTSAAQAARIQNSSVGLAEDGRLRAVRMGDNLHELNRKELKELCSRNNIRTAGVKHEDLVRLLRNKLYPSTPQTPRSMKARGPKVQSPGKDDGDSYKTPGKAAGKGRNLRSSTLPREDAEASSRKNSGLSRKPLLTKSNTMSSRRTNLPTKSPGVEQDAMQENFVRRLCQINGLSSLSRKGQPETASKASRLSLVNSNGKTEDMTSPRASEGTANGTAEVEPSDAGSDASRRVSEIATDAGPDTLSDFSDADEFRSVSSEPISKLSSISKRNPLRTSESSKMSQSGLSSFTAGTWDTSDHSRSMDNLLVDEKNSGRRDVTEVIFPEFPEDSNFLVGDTDALDLSFLHAGAADPEVIVNGKDHEGIQVHGKDHEVKEFDVMDSPMARDYVTYNRGSETDITENCIDSSRVSIGELTSDQGENPRDLNMENSGATSIDAADKQRNSTAIIPAEDEESKEVGHSNDLAPGSEGTESKQSCSGIMHSYYGEPITEDVEDGPEIHSELPCLESNSPPFDSKDYSVAKKLVFEPEENITPSAPLQQYEAGVEEVSNFRNSEGGPVLSVPKTIEDEDVSLHSKSVSSLDEPASQHGGLAETVSETLPPEIENTSSDVDREEQDVTNNIDREGGIASVEEFDALAKQNDAVIPSAGHQQESELADTRVSSKGIDSFETEGQDTSTLERHLSQPASAVTPSAGQQQECELADTKVSSKGIDSFETEDQDTSTLERHASQPEMDMSSVVPTNVIHSDSSLTSGNATPAKLDRSSSPANEQEDFDVKARNGECASTSATVLDYKQDEREKENMQVKLSFPLSIILWCSQSCSPVSRNRTPSLGS